ncbi:hypothetical protein K502DRAFT_301048 [Neoconidiobolus thromboides FSU 785]|nr:hypothetical protein K502DRAFT_301048 [Neoconidiobolus thromboides FSU 785]
MAKKTFPRQMKDSLTLYDFSKTAKKERQQRIKFTEEQREILMQNYQKNRVPSRSERNKIASEFGVPENSIKVFFQNQRAKDRNEKDLATPTPVKKLTFYKNEFHVDDMVDTNSESATSTNKDTEDKDTSVINYKEEYFKLLSDLQTLATQPENNFLFQLSLTLAKHQSNLFSDFTLMLTQPQNNHSSLDETNLFNMTNNNIFSPILTEDGNYPFINTNYFSSPIENSLINLDSNYSTNFDNVNDIQIEEPLVMEDYVLVDLFE